MVPQLRDATSQEPAEYTESELLRTIPWVVRSYVHRLKSIGVKEGRMNYFPIACYGNEETSTSFGSRHRI